ncbi:MAG: hypothetical protein WBE75_05300 [Candidatus Omnitrophota bacterium]
MNREHRKKITILSYASASFTFGMGAENGMDHPAQLEAMLNAQDGKRKYKVINKGVCSYNTSQILRDFKEDLRETKRPDLVLFLGGGAISGIIGDMTTILRRTALRFPFVIAFTGRAFTSFAAYWP